MVNFPAMFEDLKWIYCVILDVYIYIYTNSNDCYNITCYQL